MTRPPVLAIRSTDFRADLFRDGEHRATDGTHAYVILGGEGDPHEVITPDAIQPPTAIEVLTGVIGRDGAARSATTEIRDAGTRGCGSGTPPPHTCTPSPSAP